MKKKNFTPKQEKELKKIYQNALANTLFLLEAEETSAPAFKKPIRPIPIEDQPK